MNTQSKIEQISSDHELLSFHVCIASPTDSSKLQESENYTRNITEVSLLTSPGFLDGLLLNLCEKLLKDCHEHSSRLHRYRAITNCCHKMFALLRRQAQVNSRKGFSCLPPPSSPSSIFLLPEVKTVPLLQWRIRQHR
ncbi:hypothetical protein V5799_009255 [Amblyomma americanum]|uniref:Uncharacterized protein n=1 Tax=Amblyomma americanum TaxID=6943 RepID=A0AAQ4FAZ7_AMBAM